MNQTLAILLEKKEEAEIRMASQLGGVKVLEDPTEPQALARGTVKKLLILLLISALLGIAIAVLVDLLKSTVDSEADIVQNLDIPLLGVMPKFDSKSVKKGRRHDPDPGNRDPNLISDFSTRSWFTEAMRSIRTSLLFHAQETQGKVFALTSPMPSEGKTLTTANLALLVQRSDRKTVIIDLDLRRPRQHRVFGLPRKPGMSDYLLNDSMSIDEIIQPTHEKNLFFIGAGGTYHDPAELVGSRKMHRTLDELKEKFDYVFVDTPPVLPAVDSRLIAEHVDGIVLIARAEQTKVRSLKSTVDLLRSLDLHITGIILNHADRKYNQLYYYSYGRYHSYYHYYYRPYTYYGKTYGADALQDDDQEMAASTPASGKTKK